MSARPRVHCFANSLLNQSEIKEIQVVTMAEGLDMDNGDANDEQEEKPQAGYEFGRDSEPVSQGAEARIYQCTYLGRKAVLKQRFLKKYRHPIMDGRLNKQRMRAEVKGIMKAKQIGVDAPSIFFVDGNKNEIVMEKVEGCSAKEWVEASRISSQGDVECFNQSLRKLGLGLGECVGLLHANGMIHGDLTTSNVFLRNGDVTRIVIIDFGLSSQMKVTAEEKGVDMYVLERAIASTHHGSGTLFEAFLEGYRFKGGKQAGAAVAKLDEVRARGRKRDMIG